LVLERLTAAEGVAHYIASHIKLAETEVDYSSYAFFDLLSQALFSFNATSSACFTDNAGNVFGQITSLTHGQNSFLYTDASGELCRIACDGSCQLDVDKSDAIFCNNSSTMEKPWIIDGDQHVVDNAHWVSLFNWGKDSYISFIVTVHKNSVFKGTASIDFALEDIIKLIQFSANGTMAAGTDNNDKSKNPAASTDPAQGSLPYLVVLINRNTMNVLASTDPMMHVGGYNETTDSYQTFKFSHFNESIKEVGIISRYVDGSLGGWQNVVDQESFWSEDYVVSLVPIERNGLSMMLVFAVKQMVVQLPVMSIVFPIIVTIVFMFVLLFIAIIVMNTVIRTSVAMKELSELNFEKASLKENSHFNEVLAIQSSFTKLKAATLALTKYVSPLVVKQLLHRRIEEGAAVEMDLMHLSIMFVDMIGLKDSIVQMPEKNKSAAFTDIVSKWFAVVGKVVDNNRGMIDKFIEDCVMALFGAPEAYDNNELNACRTALVLSRRFETFKKNVGLKNVAQLQFRAGLHSGYVLVGNVGTADHINYTVCGICANTASRMTELCGKYCLAPLITGDIYDRVKEKYLCAFIDVVLLRGHKFVHTRVYHLMCEKERATAEEQKIAKYFSKIHTCMSKGQKKAAKLTIEHMLDASWSGRYLTALRILRSRIISRGLTRKMYMMSTVPPNDLTTHTLHYRNEDASPTSPRSPNGERGRRSTDRLPPSFLGAFGRTAERLMSQKRLRVREGEPQFDLLSPRGRKFDPSIFDDATIVEVVPPPPDYNDVVAGDNADDDDDDDDDDDM